MSYIDLSDVEDEGLVFVRTNNLIGYTTCVITDQPFDSVGIYYTETLTGVSKTRYLLIDPITGMKISGKNDYGPELNDLVDSMDIMKIAISKIKPVRNIDGSINEENTLKRRNEFRLHVVDIVNADTRGWADYIRRLFGKKLGKDGTKYHSVDMVNIMVKLMMGSLSPNWNSTTVNVDSRLVTGFTGALTTESIAFAQSTVSEADEFNVPIQSYIQNNSVFEEYQYINRDYTDEELSSHFLTNVRTDENFKVALSYFEDFLRTDNEFLTAVINGMQLRMDRKFVAKDMLRNNLISSSTLLKSYLDTLTPGTEQYNSVYRQLITNGMVTGQSYIS